MGSAIQGHSFRSAVLSFLAAAALAGAAEPQSVLLTAFRDDLPHDYSDSVVALTFRAIRPLNGFDRNITVYLQRRGGEWSGSGHAAVADYDYEKPANTVELTESNFAGQELAGLCRVTIQNDKKDPDECSVRFTAQLARAELLPFQQDTEPSLPPWKKDTRPFGGLKIEGTYEAEFTGGKLKGAKRQGVVLGALNHVPVPGQFGAEGNLVLSPAPGGGLKVLARMSPQRVAPPYEAYAVLNFREPLDWRQFEGLRLTVCAETRRDDAGVAVGIREARGAIGIVRREDHGVWYSVECAALLREQETVFEVPFSDFRGGGDNGYLDLDAIQALRIGVSNPYGVGDVSFTVRRVELLRRVPAGAPEPVNVQLDSRRILSFNGVTEIPKGLFGFHAAGHIFWMRSGPQKPDALEYLRQLKPGFFRGNFDSPKPGDFYHRMARELGFLDNVIVCNDIATWSRPSWMDGDLEAWLRNFQAGYRDRAAKAEALGDAGYPVWRLEVGNEPFMWARYVNAGPRNPPGKKAWEDPGQHGYLPGPLLADVYSRIFLAAADGVQSVRTTRVQVGGPCSDRFNGDDYSHFRLFVAPFIDRCAERIGFLTEHHYFGEPASYAASYDVVKGYCDVRHQRRTPIYNTECNNLCAHSANRAHYNLVEILACLQVCPDVAAGRAMHAMGNGYCGYAGETAAYLLLSRLRGKLLPIQSSDSAVWAAACLSETGEVVVVLFNAAPTPRTVRLQGVAELRLAERLRLRLALDKTVDPAEGVEEITLYPPDPEPECRLERLPLPAPAGKAGELDEEVPPRSALRWTFVPLAPPAARARPGQVSVCQSFWERFLARVQPKDPVAGRIVWRTGAPAGAEKAWLRVITRDVHRGEGVALLNGVEVPLPWSSSNDECAVVQELPIPVAALKLDTVLEFRCTAPARFNGFTVYAASILTSRSAE